MIPLIITVSRKFSELQKQRIESPGFFWLANFTFSKKNVKFLSGKKLKQFSREFCKTMVFEQIWIHIESWREWFVIRFASHRFTNKFFEIICAYFWTRVSFICFFSPKKTTTLFFFILSGYCCAIWRHWSSCPLLPFSSLSSFLKAVLFLSQIFSELMIMRSLVSKTVKFQLKSSLKIVNVATIWVTFLHCKLLCWFLNKKIYSLPFLGSSQSAQSFSLFSMFLQNAIQKNNQKLLQFLTVLFIKVSFMVLKISSTQVQIT